MSSTADPLDHIPDPEVVRRLLAEAVRRADLLRGLLRLSRRKAAYPHPALGGGDDTRLPVVRAVEEVARG